MKVYRMPRIRLHVRLESLGGGEGRGARCGDRGHVRVTGRGAVGAAVWCVLVCRTKLVDGECEAEEGIRESTAGGKWEGLRKGERETYCRLP